MSAGAPVAAAGLMPLPFGVVASTGAMRPPLAPPALDDVPRDPEAAKVRATAGKTLAIIPTIDPKDLSKAGWGIVFPAKMDLAVKSALQPLIAHRQKQASRPGRFKVFEGSAGVKPNQSAVAWLDQQGVGLAVVDPSNGVPYYLLLVGSPQEISFEFQFILDTQWCVGRIAFDTPEEYAAYAQSVVDYETSAAVPNHKRAAMWMPRHGDPATAMLVGQVGSPFAQKGLDTDDGYQLSSFLADQATKAQLTDILRGKATGGPPAVLFTGSHGLEWSKADAAGQKLNQGALVTQEWTPGTAVAPGQCFNADDVPADCALSGTVAFLFACFGGGCPDVDTYETQPDGSPLQIADAPMLARLPQRLLSKGALAVMAHVDRAWNWSFQTGSGMPQNQVIRSTMEAVMTGLRVGQAADFFNLQWSTLAALLGVLQSKSAANPIAPPALANLMVARDDARNYVLFGDPAARLRLEDMQA